MMQFPECARVDFNHRGVVSLRKQGLVATATTNVRLRPHGTWLAFVFRAASAVNKLRRLKRRSPALARLMMQLNRRIVCTSGNQG
jgi:hypothetical protein